MIFYTDVKNLIITDAAMIRFFNVETKAKNWNSKRYIDVIDAKLFVIEKAIELCSKKAYSIKIILNIWIFTDCANTITRWEKFEFRTHLIKKTALKLQRAIWNRSQNLYSLNFKICKNFEKFINRQTSQEEIKKDRKSRQFHVISIFEQKN